MWFQAQLIAPAAALLAMFEVYPIVVGLIISLRRFAIYRPTGEFVGVANYKSVLLDPHFYGTVLPNTFLYMLIAVALEVLLGLALALLLIERPYLGAVLQTVFLLPLMLPMVITGLIFVFMFNDQFGAINQIIQLLGGPYIPWLSQRWRAFAVAVMADIWMFTPYFMVLLYAALESLPPEPLEAAEIDGATYWQKLRHIVLPLLYPIMVVAIVIRLFDTLRAFDIIWTVTNGGPGTSTEVLSIYAYKKAFTNLQIDLGAAAGIVGAILSILVGLLFFRTFQRSIAGRYEGT